MESRPKEIQHSLITELQRQQTEKRIISKSKSQNLMRKIKKEQKLWQIKCKNVVRQGRI